MAEVKIDDPMANELRSQYPSNSRIAKPIVIGQEKDAESTKRERVKSVVSGKAALQKETFGEKLKKTFLPGDIQDIKSYIWKQLIIPGIQASILSTIEMLFYGQASRRSFGGSVNNRQTNYSYISSNGSSIRPSYITQHDRATHNFRNIIFESAQDAEDVIGTLLDLIDRTGLATVADYYDAAGIQAEWADENWGWKSFKRLESRRVRDGYIIDMEPPIQLK